MVNPVAMRGNITLKCIIDEDQEGFNRDEQKVICHKINEYLSVELKKFISTRVKYMSFKVEGEVSMSHLGPLDMLEVMMDVVQKKSMKAAEANTEDDTPQEEE